MVLTSVPNFIKIYQLVQNFVGGTDMEMAVVHRTLCKIPPRNSNKYSKEADLFQIPISLHK
jgi:hypothetical protein